MILTRRRIFVINKKYFETLNTGERNSSKIDVEMKNYHRNEPFESSNQRITSKIEGKANFSISDIFCGLLSSS